MSTVVETGKAGPRAIPRRMHLPYARRVARMGYDIRRAGWTDKWWRFRGGIWLVVEDGVERVLGAGDAKKADFLAWDWTTVPVSCADDTSSQSADLAELLRVRPYDGLAEDAVPVDLGCDLPVLQVAGAVALGPSVVEIPGVPPVSEDPALIQGESFDPLVIPVAADAGAWKRTKQGRLQVPEPEPEPDPVSLMFTVTSSGLPACYNYPVGATGYSMPTAGFLKFTGGAPGAVYAVQIKCQTTFLPIAPGLVYTINVPAGELVAWANQLPAAQGFGAIGEPGAAVVYRASWSLVGGSSTGHVDVTLHLPPACSSGSGE